MGLNKYGNVFALCKNGDENKAKEDLIEMLQDRSVGLILKKSRVTEKHDALSIFYDAILEQVDEVVAGKFVFENDRKFEAYFKTKCLFKAKTFVRENIAPFIPKGDIDLLAYETMERKYEDIRNQEYEKKGKLYDIDLSPDPASLELPKHVVAAFHRLSDKCKIMIILKKLMNISHRKIVETVGTLYTIGNENVSKNILRRCWKTLVEQSN